MALRSRQQTEETITADSQLTPEQMAAYLRQSTTRQTRNNLESADLQLSGAQKYAVSHGLDADKIVVAHEGNGTRGVSGTLRIDEREKLQEIMSGIYAGTVKVVWAYSVSRLFRDKYGVQVGTFIQACAKNHVKVVIETAQTFDFNDSMHVMIFQILANVAAKENDDRARLMHEAKAQKAQRGQYHGRPLTPGFIIDRDKLLPDGKPNPNYGKYKPYEPHAQVTACLYARYRQLNGAFNVLASEVAAMPVVYPDFESWVDARDIAQFRLTKVQGGYKIGSDVALRNLLTAVEVVGYWKVVDDVEKVDVPRAKDTHKGVKGTTYTKREYYHSLLTDENGNPKKNHEGIVPMGDWQYAFNRLSWDCLDGTPNPNRVEARATWKPVKKDRQEPLLIGLLTASTNTGRVQFTKGYYKLMERRPNHLDDSVTLQLKAEMIDKLFTQRMHERYTFEGTKEAYDQLYEELKAVQATNAKALVSVDEQMANYERKIANRQALLDAMGTDIDKELAKQYNADIKDAHSHLNELRAKRNAANAEESQLTELCSKIDLLLMGKIEDRDVLRRFIKLATEKIELAEYSAHFATLTIQWSAPFAQTDVCYIYLADGVHGYWSEEDESKLVALYPQADRLELLRQFPTRSWASILSRANDMGLDRFNYKHSSHLPIQVSIKDQEILDKLGVDSFKHPDMDDLWEYDVSVEPSRPHSH